MDGDMVQYAIVHTAQRGGGEGKVENIWRVLLVGDQVESLRDLLRREGEKYSDCDLHCFELLPLKQGTLAEVSRDVAAVIFA